MASTTKSTCLGKVKTKTSSPATPTPTATQRTEKEKIKTPSSATDTTAQGRRSTKPMVSRSSSSKGLSTPNYLKGTVRSSMDAAKIPNKQAADDTSLKYSTTRRQSIDKPPSPAQLNRTLSSSPKERRLTTPSPPPKKTISSKTLPTKTQPSKPSNIKKSTPRARRDQSRSSSAATTPTPSSPEKDENLVVKPQVEDKEIHVEPIEVQVQSSPTHDHASSIDAIPTEEPQLVTKSPTQEPHNQVADSLKEEEIIKEEEEIIKEENPTPPEESDVVNVEVKQGEDDSENNTDVSEKANQVEENEAEISGGKTESHNVVLKRQDTQGKKESPAYNNVIEETASKLVQKRKGKVLALVGAFETVINLESDNQQNEGA